MTKNTMKGKVQETKRPKIGRSRKSEQARAQEERKTQNGEVAPPKRHREHTEADADTDKDTYPRF